MKDLICLTLLLCLSWTSNAQGVEYEIKNQGNYKGTVAQVLKWDGDVTVITELQSINKMKSYVTTYRNGKGTNAELGLPFKNGYRSHNITKDGRFFRLALEKNKKARKLTRKLCEYNENGDYIDVRTLKELDYNKYSDFPMQYLLSSPNDSITCIIDNYDENRKSEDHTVSVSVYKKNFELLREFSIKRSGAENQKTIQLMDYALTDSGDVFLVYRNSGKGSSNYKKQNGKKVPAYTYEVIKVTNENEEIRYDVPDGNYFHWGISIFLTKSGNPICLSLILNTQKWDSYGKGVSTYLLDQATNKLVANHHIFSDEEIERFGDWKKGKKIGVRPNSIFRGNYLKGDDAIHVQLERYDNPTRKNHNMKYKVNVLESSVVLSVSNTGEVYNSFHVPKYFEKDYFQGYSILFFHNGKPALFYNDLYNNYDIDIKKYRKFKGYNIFGSGPTHCVVAYQGDDGNVVRQGLEKTKKGYAYTKLFNNENDNPKVVFNSDIKILNIPDLNILTLKPNLK